MCDEHLKFKIFLLSIVQCNVTVVQEHCHYYQKFMLSKTGLTFSHEVVSYEMQAISKLQFKICNKRQKGSDTGDPFPSIVQ